MPLTDEQQGGLVLQIVRLDAEMMGLDTQIKALADVLKGGILHVENCENCNRSGNVAIGQVEKKGEVWTSLERCPVCNGRSYRQGLDDSGFPPKVLKLLY